MVRLLVNAALAAGRPTPEQATLKLQAGVWSEALVAIPDAWLEQAFGHAVQAKRDSFPLSVGDVLAAWDALLLERQTRAEQTDPSRLLPPGPTLSCETCRGKHWINVGKLGLLKCPDCDGQSEPEGARGVEPSYLVQNLMPVLEAFCQEHADPLPRPARLEYALACARVGLYAETVRPTLEATELPTLYDALTALGVPVRPPVIVPRPGTPEPPPLEQAASLF